MSDDKTRNALSTSEVPAADSNTTSAVASPGTQEIPPPASTTSVSTDTGKSSSTTIKPVDYKANPKLFRTLLWVVLGLAIGLFGFYFFGSEHSLAHQQAAMIFLSIAVILAISGLVFIGYQFSGIKDRLASLTEKERNEKHSNYDFFANFYILLFGLALVFLILGVVVWQIYPLRD